jgi:hypothetical protein
MTPNDFAKFLDIACQIATKTNKSITVLSVNNTYYFIDAFEWENDCEFIGKYLITVEPGQNSSQLFHIAGNFANHT